MEKLLLTGANGFVGHYAAQALAAKGFDVLATGRGDSRGGLPVRYRPLDFTDAAAVQRLFAEEGPGIIVHAGALSKPDECELNRDAAFTTNVTGTRLLLEAAGALGAYFVFLSTDFVFDGEKGMYTETDRRGPVNYYGHTKMEAEDAVMAYAHDRAIIRTVLVYGKPVASRSNLLTMVAEALRKQETLRIFNDQLRTPTFVEDLAEGIAAAVARRATGIYHLSGTDQLTPYQMALAVADRLQLPSQLIHAVTESTFSQPARRPLRTGFCIDKARKDLDFGPVPFREGLLRTFAME